MIYSLDSIIKFGKHKGETIQDILNNDVTYIEWALDEIDNFELDDDASNYFNEALSEHYTDFYDLYPAPGNYTGEWYFN